MFRSSPDVWAFIARYSVEQCSANADAANLVEASG